MKVTKLPIEPVVTCPNCDNQAWFLHTDDFNQTYETITAHECVECGYKVEFEREE